MRLVRAVLVSVAVALATGSAAADPPAGSGTAPAAHHGFVRPILFGIVAAAFLLFGAVVGANDRREGDPER